jgi:hypothetical protein
VQHCSKDRRHDSEETAELGYSAAADTKQEISLRNFRTDFGSSSRWRAKMQRSLNAKERAAFSQEYDRAESRRGQPFNIALFNIVSTSLRKARFAARRFWIWQKGGRFFLLILLFIYLCL